MPSPADQLPTDRFPLEKSEAEHLAERRGKAYSLGHQRCYLGPIELIADGDRPLSILDVGSGIGWGYEQMISRLQVEVYIGVERHADSAAIHSAKLGNPNHLLIGQSIFSDDAKFVCRGQFDYAFCIEVAEHIDAKHHHELFTRLRQSLAIGGMLFLSTPDASQHPHGNLTKAQAKAGLLAAGFASVVCLTEHWTTLYIAEVA